MKRITRGNVIIFPLLAVLGLFMLISLMRALPGASAAGPANSKTSQPSEALTAHHSAGMTATAYLPLVRSPIPPPPLPEFGMQITPEGGINASTYVPHSFQLWNHPDSGQKITQVHIDLSTGLFPDMVFDPYGLAGDFVAKDLEVNFDSGVGFINRTYAGFHDDGYDILTITFSDFDPGEAFHFSVDVDPTSIRGVAAPGPGESGSVSGLELTGATVTVTYDSGLIVTGQTFHTPASTSGSQLFLRAGLPERPTVEVLGVPNLPATVNNPNQVLRISGPPNQRVRVFVVQGALFTDGLPGGGFDIQPYEANSALLAGLQEYTTSMQGSTVDVPITLYRTQSEGGLNHIAVVFENEFGMLGLVSQPIVLELQP